MKTRIRFESGTYLLAGSTTSIALIDETQTSPEVTAALSQAVTADPAVLINSLESLASSQQPSSFAAALALGDSLIRVVVTGSMVALVEFTSGTVTLEPFGGAMLSLVLPTCDVIYLQSGTGDALIAGGHDLVDGQIQRASRAVLELRERTHLDTPAAKSPRTPNTGSRSQPGSQPQAVSEVVSEPAPESSSASPEGVGSVSEIITPIPITRNPNRDYGEGAVLAPHLPPPPPAPKNRPTTHRSGDANGVVGVLVTDDGITHDLVGDVIIGREPETHRYVQEGSAEPLRLPDPSLELSRAHLGIFLDGNKVTVRDLGSSNGSILLRAKDDEPTPIYSSASTIFEVGDRILLGKRTIELT